jgi:hypothetical protein
MMIRSEHSAAFSLEGRVVGRLLSRLRVDDLYPVNVLAERPLQRAIAQRFSALAQMRPLAMSALAPLLEHKRT